MVHVELTSRYRLRVASEFLLLKEPKKNREPFRVARRVPRTVYLTMVSGTGKQQDNTPEKRRHDFLPSTGQKLTRTPKKTVCLQLKKKGRIKNSRIKNSLRDLTVLRAVFAHNQVLILRDRYQL